VTEREVEASDRVVVRRLDGGPVLVIEGAAALAGIFFTTDASSAGPNAYDEQAGRSDPVRIVDADITTINQTMRARSPHTAWSPILDTLDPLPWLAALDPRWDLATASDERWRGSIRPAMADAFVATLAPYRNLAVVTKVLHLNRPRLFPVLDRLVVEQIGGIGRPPIVLVDHLRSVLHANRLAIGIAVAGLEKVQIVRSSVRVLDGLLWVSHPAASLSREISSFERQIGPANRP